MSPPDRPLSLGAFGLLVRLCRSPDGTSLGSLDAEAVAAAEELHDAEAIVTLADCETLVVAAWAVEWVRREPKASEYELNESDLAGSANRRDAGSEDPFNLDTVADPSAVDPSDAAAAAEEEERRPRRGDYAKAGLPQPTVILGLSGQWPELNRRIPCGGCGGRKLPRTWYCAANGCDRSGLDHIIGHVQPLPLDKPAGGPRREWKADRASGLAGGTGPAAGAG
jgi:hypothetical protein